MLLCFYEHKTSHLVQQMDSSSVLVKVLGGFVQMFLVEKVTFLPLLCMITEQKLFSDSKKCVDGC